jgi:hypothetical protein
MARDEADASGGGTTRRDLVQGTLALSALASVRSAARSGEDADELEAFYGRWIARARALIRAEEPDEDALLWALAADVACREPGFFPGRRLTIYSGEGLQTGPVGRDDVFQLIEVVLAPGAVVPAHNHVAYAFLTLCLEGEARIRHYELEPGAPQPAEVGRDFAVRAVQDLLLRPGLFSTLTRTRANVHAIEAGPEGVRLLDLGVKFPPSEVGPRAFGTLEVEPAPSDARRGVHAARWLGSRGAKDGGQTK